MYFKEVSPNAILIHICLSALCISQVKMEERLNAVDRDIGRVRMILRNNKAL